MKICVMCAVATTGDRGGELLGIVVGRTLDECRQKASRKWTWYPGDYSRRYFAGLPKVTTRWMTLPGP